jgi:D-glycero-D-manno-heptose 1,7-bisphosphate phosphatase
VSKLSYLDLIDPPFLNRPLAIFDRDGTLNSDSGGYTHKLVDYFLEPSVKDALVFLTKSEINVAIATNQSGVGRGYFDIEDFKTFMNEMYSDLSSGGVLLQGVAACFHIPESNCECRKPKPGQLIKLIESIPNNGKVAFFGDQETDVEAALNSCIEGVLVGNEPLVEYVKRWVA